MIKGTVCYIRYNGLIDQLLRRWDDAPYSILFGKYKRQVTTTTFMQTEHRIWSSQSTSKLCISQFAFRVCSYRAICSVLGVLLTCCVLFLVCWSRVWLSVSWRWFTTPPEFSLLFYCLWFWLSWWTFAFSTFKLYKYEVFLAPQTEKLCICFLGLQKKKK